MLSRRKPKDTREALSFLIITILFLVILLVTFVLFTPLITSQPSDPLSILTGVIIVDFLILLLLVFLPKDILTLAVVGIVFLTSLILTPLLISGDIETDAQRDLGPLRRDVLKVPHQGAATSDLGWLVSSAPAIAVISVGSNDYGHPSDRVVEALESAGSLVLRTDVAGTITIPFDRVYEMATGLPSAS